jgi:nitroimidazol reductase NimA-like FMN-containing flavoprotein (pyridoxamine 5'-phosphate oxidase superfamily)
VETNREKTILRELFESQDLGVLATESGSQPHTSLVAFACKSDLKTIVFATPRTTRKFSNLKANPSVAILIDSRSHSDSDFVSTVAVTAYGKAVEVGKQEREKCIELFLARHPYLKDFVLSADCALVNISVEKYSIVSDFQNVKDLIVET